MARVAIRKGECGNHGELLIFLPSHHPLVSPVAKKSFFPLIVTTSKLRGSPIIPCYVFKLYSNLFSPNKVVTASFSEYSLVQSLLLFCGFISLRLDLS